MKTTKMKKAKMLAGPNLQPSRLPNLADIPEKIKPYHFHGVELDWRKGTDWVPGTCPFCHKDSHFFVKLETGQMKCQRCLAEGNTYTFLDLLWLNCFKFTPTDRYEALARNRGVSVESLVLFELAWNPLTRDFIIPGHNTKGVITNLYRCVVSDVGGELRINVRGTPGCKITPFGLTEFRKQPAKSTVIVTEGLWDACALHDELINANPAEAPICFTDTALLPVPSAGNFQGEWFSYLEDKDVLVPFDNDHPKLYPADHEKAGEIMMNRGQPVRPGWDGMQRIVKLAGSASKKPKSLKIIHWGKEPGHNPELPDGYDVRDHLLRTVPELPGFVLPGLAGLLAMHHDAAISSPTKEPAKQSAVKPIECTSFEGLCDHYAKAFHMTQDIRDTLAVMLAVILSTDAEPINHLWLRVIGPPGSLKSTLAEAVSAAREYVNPKSVLTGFHSGFLDPSGDGSSSSLIPQFDRKTAVIKDADTLSNSPHRDQILRELRDLYDGTSRSAYRNKQGDEFEDIRITFILCGTDELRNLNRTFLGERFIDVEVIQRGEDTSPYLRRVVESTYEALMAGWKTNGDETPDDAEEQHSPTFIKSVTYGFIDYLKKNYKSFRPPHMDETTKRLLEAMGVLVAKIRARNRKDAEINYKPRTELGTRPGAQFTKLSFFLGLVFQKDHVDEEVLRVTRKVTRDTCVSFQWDIVQQLAHAQFVERGPYDGGVDLRQLLEATPAPETTVRRILDDMREFGVIRRRAVANNSGQRGRDRHVWELTDLMRELWATVFPIIVTQPAPTKSPGRRRGAPLPVSSKSTKTKRLSGRHRSSVDS